MYKADECAVATLTIYICEAKAYKCRGHLIGAAGFDWDRVSHGEAGEKLPLVGHCDPGNLFTVHNFCHKSHTPVTL